MSGRFITVEGGEGAGKSTSLEVIGAVLDAAGIDWELTREPGGTPLGERLRRLLLDSAAPAMGPDAELLLVFAARAQHLEERIRPALAAGRWVVSDRFTDATYAYQGAGRGVAADRISALEDWVQGGLRPDLTLLLDVAPEQGLERALRGRRPDRFEREQLDFYQRVRRAYLARAEAEPDRFRVVDAGRSRRRVAATVRRALERFLEEDNA